MSATAIARWRLVTQRLVAPHLESAASVVGGLLAMQAEQPGPTSWAIAARTADREAAALSASLASGEVVRTHVLRPTWHYVLADDLVWLLDLTGPRVRKTVGGQLRVAHGLDGAALARALDVVVEAVGARPDLTRPVLAEELALRGLPLTGQPLMLLLAYAELDGHVCGGVPSGSEHTYALVSARAPHARRLERDEALAELALRYFAGHGPATERDLAYWATLPLGDVRRGLAAAGPALDTFVSDGRTFWHAPGAAPPRTKGRPAAHLLSLFDEIYPGYQDSRLTLDAAGLLTPGREPSTSIALVDGQLVARVGRTLTPSALRFELTPYRPISPSEERDLRRAAEAQAAFFARAPDLAVVGG